MAHFKEYHQDEIEQSLKDARRVIFQIQQAQQSLFELVQQNQPKAKAKEPQSLTLSFLNPMSRLVFQMAEDKILVDTMLKYIGELQNDPSLCEELILHGHCGTARLSDKVTVKDTPTPKSEAWIHIEKETRDLLD
jgi:hypothetical protein